MNYPCSSYSFSLWLMMSRLKHHLELKLRSVQHEWWNTLPQSTIKWPLNIVYLPLVSKTTCIHFSKCKLERRNRKKMNTCHQSSDCGHQTAPAESFQWCGWVLCSGRNKPKRAGGEGPDVGWSPLETAHTAWSTPHEMPSEKPGPLSHTDYSICHGLQLYVLLVKAIMKKVLNTLIRPASGPSWSNTCLALAIARIMPCMAGVSINYKVKKIGHV